MTAQPVLAGQSGGSRGRGRRNLQSLELRTHDAACIGSFLSAFGLKGRPTLVWYPAPPILSGIGNTLALTKAGNTPERWVYPTRIGGQPESAKARVLIVVTVAMGRLGGARIPFPRHLPPEAAHEIATWAARKIAAGTPPLIAANPSATARICAAAVDRGIDLDGTFFRMGGEPFTPAKRALLEAVGASGACLFYNGEVGGLSGIPCADTVELDDVHVCSHRLALGTRDVELRDGTIVPAMCCTTIHHTARTTAINLVTDDFAVVEERECTCELGNLGLNTHVHSIRSFEKLTGEGVSFLGEPLIELVERVLPARHGGALTDYQFAEREIDGMTRLELRVSPRIGPVDSSNVVETVLDHLSAIDGAAQVMADLWRAAGTVEVVREDPELTRSGKVLPLALAPRSDQSAGMARQSVTGA
jgi:hypothetical protein